MERTRTLSGQLLQTAAAFQGIAALPIVLIMSGMALEDFFYLRLKFFEFL
jgi:hypothetical protein